MAEELSAADVRRVRLAAQGITRPLADPAAAIRRATCTQSQELAQSWWSVRLRCGAGTAAAYRAAYDAGELLRTHVLRPTWHTVHRTDLRWVLELTGPRVVATLTTTFRRLGTSVADVDQAQRVIADQVESGPQTRVELAQALTRRGIDLADPIVLANLIMQAELEQVVCSGPVRGRQPTYVPFDTRCPTDLPAPAEPVAELLRRCVTGRGPISLRDVARWSGLTLTRIRQALRAATDLTMITVAGVELVHDPTATQQALILPPAGSPVRVLPEFDELTLSYRDLAWPWLGDPPTSVPTTMINRNPGMIMVGDRLAGYWARSLTEQQLTVTTALTGSPASEVRAEVAETLVQLAAFYGVELVHESV